MYVDAPFCIVYLHLMKVLSVQIYELALQYASFTLKVNSRLLHFIFKLLLDTKLLVIFMILSNS